MDNNMPDGGFNSAPQQGSKGLAVASMILGICSIVVCCIWYLSLVLGVIGIVLGILSKKNNNPGGGMATAGIVTSAIGIALAVILVLFLAAWLSEYLPFLEEYAAQ